MILYIKKLINNKLLKNSMLYTIGGMLAPMLGIIMLPIYTNYLSVEEYGIMTTVQTLTGMIALFLLLSLNSAVTRFFYDYLDEPEKQKRHLGSIFTFVILFSTIVSIILLVFKDPLGSLLFKNIPITPFYYYLIGLSLVEALNKLPMALFRAQEKAGTYISVNILRAVLIAIVSIYLIIVKGMGAESALISQFVITLLITVFSYGMQFKRLTFSLNLTFIKQSLLLSLPLLPHAASVWIISSSDRIILEKYVDLAELGIYSLAVQVSMVLSIFYTSINNAVVPRYTRLRKEGKQVKAKKILKVFSYVILIFGVLSIPIAMMGIKLLSSQEYHSAVIIIPILLIGHMIRGFYLIPVAKLFYSKKTVAIAKSSTIAAIINIIINLIAIPFIGVYGAIISTIVAEIVSYLLIYRASKIHG